MNCMQNGFHVRDVEIYSILVVSVLFDHYYVIHAPAKTNKINRLPSANTTSVASTGNPRLLNDDKGDEYLDLNFSVYQFSKENDVPNNLSKVVQVNKLTRS